MKRSIYLIVISAFLLRFGLGVSAANLLPKIGYTSKAQQAGYLFFDAYRRDTQAWNLAQSSKPLLHAFEGKFSSDQYGGLLWISAFLYRYLSGSIHQPLLIVFLAAIMGSLGVVFVYLTARRLYTPDVPGSGGQIQDFGRGEKLGLYSALVFAFFPEAILLGASQMREPFLMTLIAMAFYGLTDWQAARKKRPWLWVLFALAGMLFISPGFAVVTLVAAVGWVYFSQPVSGLKIPWQVFAGALVIFVLALVVVAASWDSLVAAKGGGFLGVIGNWARETTRWNAYLLERSSGIVQVLFSSLPPALALPFVAIYGILQPVLPAVLLEPGIAFWQALGITRALGWYLLLPFLAFAPLAAATLAASQKNKSEKGAPSDFNDRSRAWLWLSLVVWAWILIAAVRGGGDQWDNPRYRVILLAWMALLAAGVLDQIRTRAGRWFWRICGVELIILLVFGHWYSWRYLGFGINIGIRNTLLIAIAFSVLLVLSDWLWCKARSVERIDKPVSRL